jgi:hypothetical protein
LEGQKYFPPRHRSAVAHPSETVAWSRTAAVFLLLLILAVPLNLRRARIYQPEIDAVDTLEKSH